MSRYLRFTDHLNEAVSKKVIIQDLINAFPKTFGKHSNSSRIKNLDDISIDEFEQKIIEVLGATNTKIVNVPQSGSSKFSAVEFIYDSKPHKIILAGGAVASKGHGFEYDLEADLKVLADEKVYDPELYTYKNIIKDIIKEFKITEKSDVKVIPEGGQNTRRPLSINHKGIHIGIDNNLDIGRTVSDITLMVDGVPKFLSLKLGLTVQFSNTGTVSLFPTKEIKSGMITNKSGLKLMEFLGLDNETFCKVFNEFGKTNFKDKHINKKVDSKLISNFLKEAIGYGYYMVHIDDKGQKYKFYEITKSYMNKASKLKGGDVEIKYGGVSGNSKDIRVIFDTPVFDMTIDFRNRNGGIYPNVMGTRYKYIDFAGKPVL